MFSTFVCSILLSEYTSFYVPVFPYLRNILFNYILKYIKSEQDSTVSLTISDEVYLH